MWCWVEVFSVVGGRARVPLTASAQSAPFENRRAKEKKTKLPKSWTKPRISKTLEKI